MKISGSFRAIDQNGNVIGCGDNLIVEQGKQFFINWLLHNGFQNVTSLNQLEQNVVYQGKSLSSQRFLTNEQFDFIYKDIDENNVDVKLFWANNGYLVLKPQRSDSDYYALDDITFYCQLTENKDISGLFLNVPSIDLSSTNDFRNSQYVWSVYTSEHDYTYADSYKLWVLRKNHAVDSCGGADINNYMIRFQDAYSVDNYIKNVKSIKIVLKNLKSYWSYYGEPGQVHLSGIGILTKQPYYNVPCVIGLGSLGNPPKVNDDRLNKQVCRLYVSSQKASISYDNGQNNETTKVNFTDLSKVYTKQSLANAKKIDVIYRCRLGYQDYNGCSFKEIGLFYSNGQIDVLKGANQCNTMFSHGVFDRQWVKQDNKIIDIQYILSITT